MVNNVFWLCFHLAIAKVKLDFIAKQDDELSLRKGEKVEVLCKEQEHWWKGSINGK